MLQNRFHKISVIVRSKFKTVTRDFLFIFLFITLFGMLFGPENSIVGVILTILMMSSLAQDLTATPVKNLIYAACILEAMTLAAFLTTALPPLWAVPFNFLMVFFLLYTYTFEYASHLYMPYILSYLFLIFLAPIGAAQLPRRLFCMLVGAGCIMAYQLIRCHTRAADTVQEALNAMLDEAGNCVCCLLTATATPADPETVRAELCKLSRVVYERRKRALCVSDASFSMLDAGRGLEHVILQLYALEGPITPAREVMLRQLQTQLSAFRAFTDKECGTLPLLDRNAFGPLDDAEAEELYQSAAYIREHLLHMADPDKRTAYRPTAQSLSIRLKAALDVSPVRVVYALRVAALLAVFTALVQHFQLPHGKWLLFTLASVSMPYADDVAPKAKKRLIATLLGGAVAWTAFSLLPSPGMRTAVMMLSGYLTSYFSDYRFTFACATVGGLGGAVTGLAGWREIGGMFGVRLGYILLGIAIACVVNRLLFPFMRRTATDQLWKKYAATTALLSELCRQPGVDVQLYYSLVIQAHLIEQKLLQNASDARYNGMGELLATCRDRVRRAHRMRSAAGF